MKQPKFLRILLLILLFTGEFFVYPIMLLPVKADTAKTWGLTEPTKWVNLPITLQVSSGGVVAQDSTTFNTSYLPDGAYGEIFGNVTYMGNFYDEFFESTLTYNSITINRCSGVLDNMNKVMLLGLERTWGTQLASHLPMAYVASYAESYSGTWGSRGTNNMPIVGTMMRSYDNDEVTLECDVQCASAESTPDTIKLTEGRYYLMNYELLYGRHSYGGQDYLEQYHNTIYSLNETTGDVGYLGEIQLHFNYTQEQHASLNRIELNTAVGGGSAFDVLVQFYTSRGVIPSNSAPTATTLEITNPTDGLFIMAGSGTDYTLRFVGTDSDGGSDISTLHGSLVFDDTHRLNISITETTVTFLEGGDYVVHSRTTITTLGNTKTVDLVLAFKETTPIVNNINGYLKVTDASAETSGWTSFPDVISTMLYEADGGGGGTTPPTESQDGEIETTEEEEPVLPWWVDPPEYLIEFKNPLDPTKTINLIPLPWDWTRAQKMSSLFILWLLLFLLIAYILDETRKSKAETKRIKNLRNKQPAFDYSLVKIVRDKKNKRKS